MLLSGINLKLQKRCVKDIIGASLFDQNKKEVEDKLFLNGFIIYSSLKRNIKEVPFYKFKDWIKNKKLKKIITVENIIGSLSLDEMTDACQKIYELDFGKADKKKVENQQI